MGPLRWIHYVAKARAAPRSNPPRDARASERHERAYALFLRATLAPVRGDREGKIFYPNSICLNDGYAIATVFGFNFSKQVSTFSIGRSSGTSIE